MAPATLRIVLDALRRSSRRSACHPTPGCGIVAGHTDMRKGFEGLAAVAQSAPATNPFCGHVFVFRGRRGDILKVLWFDGQGLMLLAKRLERGRFVCAGGGLGRRGVDAGAAVDAAGGHRLAHAHAHPHARAGGLMAWHRARVLDELGSVIPRAPKPLAGAIKPELK